MSAEAGIRSWLSAFAIGLTIDDAAELRIYAPYGLANAFAMRVCPNKIAMTEASYLQITQGYLSYAGHRFISNLGVSDEMSYYEYSFGKMIEYIVDGKNVAGRPI